MIKNATIVLALVLACGCQKQRSTEPQVPLEILTGTVIRKEWTKSEESWNAGGSEYYVLKVEGSNLPAEKWSAKEGVILRPSKAILFDDFAKIVGETVTCQGEFVAGEPYKPPVNSPLQYPLPVRNPFTGELDYPTRGSGFKVYEITIKGTK